MISKEDADLLKQLSAEDGLKFISGKFSEGVVFSTSLGQEDQVITDMIFKNHLSIKVFTLDTGRLFYEHYDLLSQNNSRYKI
ncbi:MAG TPA: phosphoadenosine phosphosulfate reductase family protein, partial [Flavobacterium sp.]|nr:phosphoadenosine phosphosulfate reductase family protein [Flavobacterium sp.]